jgi:uncharacterized circularly permuted ATP-grasp superfamily protein
VELSSYDLGGFFDEMFEGTGQPRSGARLLYERLRTMPFDELHRRQTAAERTLLTLGITFNVYGHEAGTEKIFIG